MFYFMNAVRSFMNYAIFRELCDWMREILPSHNTRRPNLVLLKQSLASLISKLKGQSSSLKRTASDLFTIQILHGKCVYSSHHFG